MYDAVTAFIKLFCKSARIHERRSKKSGKSTAYYQVSGERLPGKHNHRASSTKTFIAGHDRWSEQSSRYAHSRMAERYHVETGGARTEHMARWSSKFRDKSMQRTAQHESSSLCRSILTAQFEIYKMRMRAELCSTAVKLWAVTVQPQTLCVSSQQRRERRAQIAPRHCCHTRGCDQIEHRFTLDPFTRSVGSAVLAMDLPDASIE